jgi:hypothetical protein
MDVDHEQRKRVVELRMQCLQVAEIMRQTGITKKKIQAIIMQDMSEKDREWSAKVITTRARVQSDQTKKALRAKKIKRQQEGFNEIAARWLRSQPIAGALQHE